MSLQLKDILRLSVIEWMNLKKDQVGWLVVQVLWHINLCRLFNAKSIFL